MDSGGRPSFGVLLRRFRLAAAFSQEALAERAGMSIETIGALERGARRSPYRQTVTALAEALHLGPDERSRLEVAASRPQLPRLRASPRRAYEAGPDPAVPWHNLPAQLSNLVGREQDALVLASLVDAHRLVTLVGGGGVGKTRLALRIAWDVLRCWPDGVWFAELASAALPHLVLGTVARVLGVEESSQRPLLASVVAAMRRKRALLVLDNCEHVIDEARSIALAVLRDCPNVKILVTSREPLNVSGERTYRVPALACPERSEVSAAAAHEYPAVVLFADRAQAADHRFRLDDENAPAVIEICRQLDGVPLAIELAAARCRGIAPHRLLKMLDARFHVLRGGDPETAPRQQTMRAAIDWSLALLAESERVLARRLAIFVGGWTLEAVTAVCSDERLGAGEILELLASLIGKSLVAVQFSGARERYRFDESIRAYALEGLAASGELATLARRHAEWALESGESMTATARTGDLSWRPDAQDELENWRAALRWALLERGDVVLGQRLVGALGVAWTSFAHVEGRRWIRESLALVDERTPPEALAQLQYIDATIAYELNELGVALASARLALVGFRALRDGFGSARALCLVGQSLVFVGRSREGEEHLREALDESRALGNAMLEGVILEMLALARSTAGDAAGARACFGDALSIYRLLGADSAVAGISLNLGEVEFRAGNAESAYAQAADALAISQRLGDRYTVTNALGNMAAYLVTLGRFDDARTHALEALDLARDLQLDIHAAWALQHLAAIGVLRLSGDADGEAIEAYAIAARLLGFADAVFDAIGAVQAFTEQQEHDRLEGILRDRLGEPEMVRLLAVGAAMTPAQAFDLARARR